MMARHAFQYPRFVAPNIAWMMAAAAETASIRMLSG
jgi:hypothetical protein